LYAWRGPATLSGGDYSPVSRETFLLLNSLLMSVATATILLGTLYPLLLDALGLGKISVGPPYFNKVFGLVMLPLVVALGLGQFARWKSDSLRELWLQARFAALGSVVLGGLLALALPGFSNLQVLLG